MTAMMETPTARWVAKVGMLSSTRVRLPTDSHWGDVLVSPLVGMPARNMVSAYGHSSEEALNCKVLALAFGGATGCWYPQFGAALHSRVLPLCIDLYKALVVKLPTFFCPQSETK
eukprot:COSAG02_NODE_9745_length_2123_cov_2.321332_2_plen_115_part_00